jgi:ribosomal protein L5
MSNAVLVGRNLVVVDKNRGQLIFHFTTSQPFRFRHRGMTTVVRLPHRLPRRALLSCRHCLPPQSRTIGIRWYNVSKLSTRLPPPAHSSPASPKFDPRLMGRMCRLSNYYEEIVKPNYLLMNYDPTAKKRKQLLPYRWDGTSPYHKNRPQPRELTMPKVPQPIRYNNIPVIQHITIHAAVNSSIQSRTDLMDAALMVQSLAGQRPKFVYSKQNIAVFKLRKCMHVHLMYVDNRYSNCC